MTVLDVDWKRAHENRSNRSDNHPRGTAEYRVCQPNRKEVAAESDASHQCEDLLDVVESKVRRVYRRGQSENPFCGPPEHGNQANQAHIRSSRNVKKGLRGLQAKLPDYLIVEHDLVSVEPPRNKEGAPDLEEYINENDGDACPAYPEELWDSSWRSWAAKCRFDYRHHVGRSFCC